MSDNLTVVLTFNAFTAKLESGYLMNRSGSKVSEIMKPARILEHMLANPDARCVTQKS